MKNKFIYKVEFDYNTLYSCQESGCYDEGICRCSTIVDAHVTCVDMSLLTETTYDDIIEPKTKSGKRTEKINKIFYGDCNIDKYCINRILTINKVWDTEVWEFDIEGGYYGQEVNDISLNINTFNKLIEECKYLLGLNTITDKIKYVLNLEYGRVLESIINEEFEEIEIEMSDIDFKHSNQQHIFLIKNKDTSFYENFTYHLGVVRKIGNKYRIIDGHHRILTSKDKTIKVFSTK